MMDRSDVVPAILFGGFILFLATIFIAMIPVNTIVQQSYQELYFTQAPFGTIYSDISGRFVWGSGSINTNPAEAYTVKYWSGNQLLSLTLDSSQTPIVVDGSFKLETINVRYPDIFGWDSGKDSVTKYVLHLPSLPENVTPGMFAP